MQYDLLPVTGEHALYAAALPLSHKDPFDRLLVAQAAVDKLVFVSKDEILGTFGIERLW
jgi:PIN domain nuclease of toxin-antitoxin system